MKVTINGETFDYDGTKAPMSEALAIEKVYKRNYAQWQTDLQAGSAEAMCVLAWIIWRRDGRNVPYEDITEGRADFDLMEMLGSIAESVLAEEEAAEQAEPDPTSPGSAGPAGTPGTGTGTRGSSRSGSGSGRGKSKN